MRGSGRIIPFHARGSGLSPVKLQKRNKCNIFGLVAARRAGLTSW